MNLLLIKGNLREALGAVERASGDNAGLPVLKNVLLEAFEDKIQVTATNLEIAVRCSVPGKVLEAGKTTLPINLISNLINNLQSERLSLTTKGQNTDIQTDNYKATIQGLSAEEFPIIPQVKNREEVLEIKGGELKEALSQVLVSAQASELRPELASVLWDYNLDQLKLVSTDSFRLSEKIIPANHLEKAPQEAFQILVPLRTNQELLRITKEDETVRLYRDPNQASFETARWELVTRLIEGKFPDYGAIVPKKFETRITLNRQELMNALKVAGVFSSRVNEVKIKIGADKKTIEVFSNEQSLGENDYVLAAQTQGEPKELSFNWRYLLDGLKALASDEVFWGLNDDNKPAILKSAKDGSYFYVLMPILKA